MLRWPQPPDGTGKVHLPACGDLPCPDENQPRALFGSFNTDIPHQLCPRDAQATFSSSASSGTPYSKTSSPCLSWHCPPCLRCCSYPLTVTHQWTAASSSPAAHSSSAGGEHLRLAPWPPRLPWYQPTSCPPRQRSPVPTASGNKGLGFRVHGFRVQGLETRQPCARGQRTHDYAYASTASLNWNEAMKTNVRKQMHAEARDASRASASLATINMQAST